MRNTMTAARICQTLLLPPPPPTPSSLQDDVDYARRFRQEGLSVVNR